MSLHHTIRVALIIASTLLPFRFAQGTDLNGGRPDLLPRHARWRTMPSDVKRVVIDPRGRAWFEIEGTVPRDQLKEQVERTSGLKAPWIKGARIIRIDRSGRVWIRANDYRDWRTLLGYDPKAKKWIERSVAPEKDRGGHDEKDKMSGVVVWTGASYESKGGRLYFSDRLGLHVFDKGKWSYQPLYRMNLARDISFDTIKSFNDPRFAETSDGRVLVWSPWGNFGWAGTLGFFIHDGKEWTQQLIGAVPAPEVARLPGVKKSDSPRRNWLRGLIPLTEDRVVVCPESGPALVRSIKEETLGKAEIRSVEKDIALLGNKRFRIRQRAQERLSKLGVKVLPLLKEARLGETDPERLNRLARLIREAEGELSTPKVDGHEIRTARLLGHDALGRGWVWADQCLAPDGKEFRTGMWIITQQGKVLQAPAGLKGWYPDSMFADQADRLYLARYGQGCIVIEDDKVVPLTDRSQTNYRYVVGKDEAGRLYLTDERTVLVYQAEAPDERAGLPTTIHPVPRNENDVIRDSEGNVRAMLHQDGNPDRGTLSVFSGGRWLSVKVPAGLKEAKQLHFFMPLKEGGLIAQPSGTRRAYFSDGDSWHEYPNLRAMVEDKHQELRKLIDNRRWGRDFYAKLRVDAEGRIWLIEWMQGAVWDGKQWIDLVKPLDAAQKGRKFDMFYYLIPGPEAKLMLATSGLTRITHEVRIEEGKVKVTPFSLPGGRKLEWDYTTRSGVWRDHLDRTWLPLNGDRGILLDKEGAQLVPETGFPRFVDARGRAWFHSPNRKAIVVMSRDGHKAELKHDALGGSTTAIAEDSHHNIWATTERGLLRLRIRETADGIDFHSSKLFEKDTPRGMCLFACVDKDDRFWFYGPGPEHLYRLYRVDLPGSERGK